MGPRASSASSHSEFVSIQILRAFAAFMIVVWHSHLSIKNFEDAYWRSDSFEYMQEHYLFPFRHLDFGVDIFFCLSGFIMCMLVMSRKEAQVSLYVSRRVARIYPMYWFFSLLVVAAYALNKNFNVGGLSGDRAADIQRIALSLSLIPQYKAPVLGVAWTLIQEMIFYCSVALILMFNGSRHLVAWIASLSAVCIALYLAGIDLVNGQLLSLYYVEFLFGALAYRFHRSVAPREPIAQILLAVALYVVVGAALERWRSSGPSLLRVFGCGTMGFFFITGSIGLERWASQTSLTTRFLRVMGDSSYVLYLSHWLVLSALGKIGGLFVGLPRPAILLWHAGSIAAAVSFALAFHFSVEKPFNKWLWRLLPTRKERSASNDEHFAPSIHGGDFAEGKERVLVGTPAQLAGAGSSEKAS
ncbi:acyltransferase [Methylocystis iwaonis]|uniref:acyltransferase family protein n=1 Tax=Methylocystis iwaonis TaxID=2885079 RepID=UPI002E7AB055|nr:acyltransferase [Methylocystis iwaonis]